MPDLGMLLRYSDTIFNTIIVVVLLVTMPSRRSHQGKARAQDMASPEMPRGLFATLLVSAIKPAHTE